MLGSWSVIVRGLGLVVLVGSSIRICQKYTSLDILIVKNLFLYFYLILIFKCLITIILTG